MRFDWHIILRKFGFDRDTSCGRWGSTDTLSFGSSGSTETRPAEDGALGACGACLAPTEPKARPWTHGVQVSFGLVKKKSSCFTQLLSFWSCGRWDLNPHDVTATRTLILLVCQFRHFRIHSFELNCLPLTCDSVIISNPSRSVKPFL